MALSYHHLGWTAQIRGRLDEADDWYRQALTIREELGDRLGMADTYHQLGNPALLRGRLDEADDWYRQALTIYEELGSPHMAGSYHQLGVTAQARGRLDEADDWYRQALAIEVEVGDLPRCGYRRMCISGYARRGPSTAAPVPWTGTVRCVTRCSRPVPPSR